MLGCKFKFHGSENPSYLTPVAVNAKLQCNEPLAQLGAEIITESVVSVFVGERCNAANSRLTSTTGFGARIVA